MASTLKVDDLRGNTSAGDITITSEGGSATMQLQQGVCKQWCNLTGSGTIAIQDSFNTSSITDTATGRYQNSLSSSMGNNDYAIGYSARQNQAALCGSGGPYNGTNGASDSRTAMATGSYKMLYHNMDASPGFRDQEIAMTHIIGDLA